MLDVAGIVAAIGFFIAMELYTIYCDRLLSLSRKDKGARG